MSDQPGERKPSIGRSLFQVLARLADDRLVELSDDEALAIDAACGFEDETHPRQAEAVRALLSRVRSRPGSLDPDGMWDRADRPAASRNRSRRTGPRKDWDWGTPFAGAVGNYHPDTSVEAAELSAVANLDQHKRILLAAHKAGAEGITAREYVDGFKGVTNVQLVGARFQELRGEGSQSDRVPLLERRRIGPGDRTYASRKAPGGGRACAVHWITEDGVRHAEWLAGVYGSWAGREGLTKPATCG